MYDVIIIGSGPAGLGAALYLQRAGFHILVVEKEFEGTGQIARSTRVENYLGIPLINGYELGEKFRKHVVSLKTAFLEGEVIALEHTESWKIILSQGEALYSKAIIYAAGASPRRLGVLGEEQYLGKGVSYCAYCDGTLYHNKIVAVVGGGDTALDDALYLSNICKKVFLIHRRNRFRGAASTLQQIKQKDNLEILTDTKVLEIRGQKKLEKVLLDNGRELEVNGLFVAVGSLPETQIIRDFVELDEHGYACAKEDGITEMHGLFVAGDIRKKNLRQVITAVSDGANAAVSAAEWLNHRPNQKKGD